MAIIAKAIKENRKKLSKDAENYVYYEAHHILPKSLFPAWRRRKSNLVLLTPREHLFVHQLLTHIYPGDQMNQSLWLMIHTRGGHRIKNSRDFERLRIWNRERFNTNKKKNANPFPGAKAAGIVNRERLSLKVYCPELGMTWSSQKECAKYFKTDEASIHRQYTRTQRGFLYKNKYHIFRVSK